MNKDWINLDNLFNPNLIYSGQADLVLKNYPNRSKNLEKFAKTGINAKDLNNKFIKNGYMYLLRGAKNGQESGFYSEAYSKKNTIESLGLDPNNVAYAQVLNGNTPFISATTDIYTAASFAQNEGIYILKVSIEDVYTFYSFEELMEKEYMIPDFISCQEIVRSFRYNKFKQIYNYLIHEAELSINPEDLGANIEEINFPNIQKIEDKII